MKVCVHCFNDIELKQFIQVEATEKGRCDYCSNGEEAELVLIDELLDFFSEFINIFKLDDRGISLNQLIQKDWELFSVHTNIDKILSTILKEINSPLTFSDKVTYIDEIVECISYWEYLKEEIKWEKRFLTNTDILDDLGWVNFFNQRNTIEWPRHEPFFRARLHYNGNQKEFSTSDMGCPDKIIVPAGRANPQGIPYLYLSKSIDTVLYEVRSTFLDELSIGSFYIKEKDSVVLVDFTEKVSVFSRVDEIIEYAKSILLKRLISNDLSKPIRRYDSEIEYIPTQFICEYIHNRSSADGIIFNSSLHQGGKNIVLFNQDKLECKKVELYRISHVNIVGKLV
ncbi:MAG: RES domain-containing protein [Bacteroidales bacterium]